jgi:hypothetical protein
MTDLTNRTIKEVDELIQKYNQLLEVSGVKTLIDAQILVIIIDVAIKHIEEKYKNLSKDWKAWTVVVLKNLRKKINNDDDVKKIIDEFVGYYALEYQKYVDDLVWHNEIDRDWGFVHGYINKKIGR